MRDLTLKGDEAKADSTTRKIEEFAQDKQFTLSEETIGEGDIIEREIKIQKVGGVVKLITKLDGVLYSVTLT